MKWSKMKPALIACCPRRDIPSYSGWWTWQKRILGSERVWMCLNMFEFECVWGSLNMSSVLESCWVYLNVFECFRMSACVWMRLNVFECLSVFERVRRNRMCLNVFERVWMCFEWCVRQCLNVFGHVCFFWMCLDVFGLGLLSEAICIIASPQDTDIQPACRIYIDMLPWMVLTAHY